MHSKIIEDWNFNLLNIYNFNKPGSLSYYFEFIKRNIDNLEGDLVEAGVHKGKSLLATAILLKKLKSKKKIYAYDTWSGFPLKYKNHPMDKFKNWDLLLKKKNYNKKSLS